MQSKLDQTESGLETLDIYASYRKSPYLSVKYSSYFQVYEELFSRYRNKPTTFVEVGVLNGGSLFMWRDYFGPEARIIGIDFNPFARKWEGSGFEIHIGNQGDPRFWEGFFSAVGEVDVVLDDGGHTNEQQIVTAHRCIPHIRNGGMLIVEDTGTSYLKAYGNPSRYSFINYSKKMIDRINLRSSALERSDDTCKSTVYSMAVYESMVCFNIDRRKCFIGTNTSNDGSSFGAEDFSRQAAHAGRVMDLRNRLSRKFSHLKRFPAVRLAQRFVFNAYFSLRARFRARELRKYFR